MKIYTPVKDFDGLRNNVRFIRGVGETNDPKLIEWFKNHGYKVEGEYNFVIETPNGVIPIPNDKVEVVNDRIDESEFVEINEVVEKEPDFENMTPNDLRDWARANGLGGLIKNTRNKEKLLEIITQNRG